MARIGLEVCVDSAAGLGAAVRGGANRIELCSALALGGLTPAPGLMRLAATCGAETFAMVRPRPGPFVCDALDLEAMAGDLAAIAAAGLAGAVIGANRPGGQLDLAALGALCAHARGLGLRLTLHRAFDLVPDQAAALDQAMALGFERVLTSGAERTAEAGAERIAALIAQAAGRISVMPGSGLTPANVASLVRRTGAGEVHGSCSAPSNDDLPTHHRQAATAFGFIGPNDRTTDESLVREMAQVLTLFGGQCA
jgi:copper homeostasis protein